MLPYFRMWCLLLAFQNVFEWCFLSFLGGFFSVFLCSNCDTGGLGMFAAWTESIFAKRSEKLQSFDIIHC